MTHLENQGFSRNHGPNRSAVSYIDRFSTPVEDLQAAQNFYINALGFHTVGLETRDGPAFAALTSLDGACALVAVMRLGEQTLELVQFAQRGRAYPQPRAANDPWFQHFAIAVSDMERAFARLSRFDQAPISRGGPARLPPSTGDVTAYKFRDPDGHALELSQAPHSHWVSQARHPTDQPTLGVDHAALAVADLAFSIGFYTEGLGLQLGPPALNQGPEQARLDGLNDPVVDIATLTTPQGGPHLELLHYRNPRSLAPPLQLGVNDIAAVRVVMQANDLDGTAERALAAGATRASPTVVDKSATRRVLLRDPDGHLIELIDPHNRRL